MDNELYYTLKTEMLDNLCGDPEMTQKIKSILDEVEDENGEMDNLQLYSIGTTLADFAERLVVEELYPIDSMYPSDIMGVFYGQNVEENTTEVYGIPGVWKEIQPERIVNLVTRESRTIPAIYKRIK